MLLLLRNGNHQMFVALDPHGIRPLSIGRLGDAYVVASETCAFGQIGAVFEREVLPGELIMIDHGGLISTRFAMREQRKMCAMEYVYLSRPDSDVPGGFSYGDYLRTGAIAATSNVMQQVKQHAAQGAAGRLSK